MKLVISIRCDNAAFDPPGPEVSRILRELARSLEGEDLTPDSDFRSLRDRNGNKVGKVVVEE